MSAREAPLALALARVTNPTRFECFSRRYVRKVAGDRNADEFDAGHLFRRVAMSYAEAKQIALLRVELRTCWENQDYAGAGVALSRLSAVAGNDNELNAEVKRWAFKLQVA
jgi:hypothetical protein